MIAVTKDEAKAVRELVNGVHIVRTMKQQSSRGKYFIEETSAALKALATVRGLPYSEGMFDT